MLLELRFTLEITVGIAGLLLTSNTQEWTHEWDLVVTGFEQVRIHQIEEIYYLRLSYNTTVIGETSLKWNWVEFAIRNWIKLLVCFPALGQVVIFFFFLFGAALFSLHRLCLPRRVARPSVGWSLSPSAAWSVWGAVPSSLQDWALPMKGELEFPWLTDPGGWGLFHLQRPVWASDAVLADPVCQGESCACRVVSCVRDFRSDLFSS